MPEKLNPVPFGTVLGVAEGGVPAYSSDYDSASDEEYPDRHSYRSYIDGIYLGYKWQCVEFARRWLYVNRGQVFDDVAMAYEIFQLTDILDVASGHRLPLQSFANGAKRAPESGCLLIWDEGGDFARTGHVAVVTEVFPDRIRIVEQNFVHQIWADGRNYSREIEARLTPEGNYWIRTSSDDNNILGWVIQTEDTRHAEPRTELNQRLLAMNFGHLDTTPDAGEAWLNVANPMEAAYVEAMDGQHQLSSRDEDQSRYLRISQAAEDRLKRVTNELHGMFMHATNHVLQNDSILARFGIPSSIWPRIHESWNNRRNQLITARMDLAMTPAGIKVYEYNCDSASCHTETAVIQGEWARHAGCDEGTDPGEKLIQCLVDAWRKSDARGTVHILIDDDPEERYHSLLMQGAMQKAGLMCKVLTSLDGLKWADDGHMLDADGEPVLWVWKTWMWETALDQIRAECEEDEQRLKDYQPGRRRESAPRLVDVLLRRNVIVFEPLWTLIPSNKAILPVLWELFPNHPNLLRSSFDLDDDLRANGYVAKPIVGRGGANIALFDVQNDESTLTDGKFDNREQVFQELYPLPVVDKLYVQICTFTVAGNYAGACARTDFSPIIDMESDLVALRVVPDKEI